MKKFIYTLLFSAVAAISISACTEQDIKPKEGLNGGGMGAYDCGQPGLPKCK
ncbi:hypothetical protein BH09BAC3_BH09BAC3_07850 [soil metagenome]